MTVTAPDVAGDPLGVVVDLIIRAEPALERATIESAVRTTAAGRAKRRRLARALLDKPTVLDDGRSPAPRVVGDLLIALRAAGAVQISPPVCARCDKRLRSLQRRGEDWYCSVCGSRREPCSVCGHTRPVNVRDQDGRPRCGKCPARDGRDPVQLVVDVVTTVDPTLSAAVVAAAVAAVTTQAGQRQQLAWALAARPELLTGAGAEAPVPSVLRLIDSLCDAGSLHVVRPACPHCGRVIVLIKPRDGVRLCRNCVAKSRAEPCGRCGAVREPATRDADGRPVCPNCLITDPANQETCVGCDRRRPVGVRTPRGPLCESCRPVPTMTCSICGRRAPCLISKTTGAPWCLACKQRWTRCVGCGQVRPVRGGSLDEPLCATCTRPDPDFWHDCATCGQPGRIHAGRCARCTLDQRLRELLGDESGEIHPHLRALHQALAATDRPTTVAAWLDSAVPTILRGLDTTAGLTHHALDQLPAAKPVEHLRAVLVAIGTLPARDEQMARLERWITHAITEQPDPDQQQLLRRYGVWHLLRRLRRRLDRADASYSQVVGVRQYVKAATVLLDWLTANDLTLATARQGDLERWLTGGKASHRRGAGHFIRWARRQKLTDLTFPAVRWEGPAGDLDTETRWDQARWLLHDATVEPEDRLAGLLVLLYAQWPATLSRLTVAHVHIGDHDVRIRLGREPIVLPEPVDALARHVVDNRRGHATIGEPATSPWLFPGGQPGRPISAYQLAERLRQLGLRPGQSRSAALFQLSTDLPAALLARMLGIHITVAVAWQRASNGDWTSYAADVSRRTNRTAELPRTAPIPQN